MKKPKTGLDFEGKTSINAGSKYLLVLLIDIKLAFFKRDASLI